MDINEKTKPVGEIVLLKKLVPTLDKKYGDIFIPHTSDKNLQMGVAQIVDMGDKAKETTGLNIGDYVFYDYYSAFGKQDMPKGVEEFYNKFIALPSGWWM